MFDFSIFVAAPRHHPAAAKNFKLLSNLQTTTTVNSYFVRSTSFLSGGNVEEGERNGISTSVHSSTNLLFFFHRTSRNKLTPKCVVVDKKENVRKKAILVAVPAAPIAVVFPSKTTIDL